MGKSWVRAESLDYPAGNRWRAFLAPLPEWQRAHLSALRSVGLSWREVQTLPSHFKRVTSRHQKLLESMTDLIDESLAPFHSKVLISGDPPTEQLDDDEKKYLGEAYEEYLSLMARAARAGLHWHPWVTAWVRNYSALGGRAVLRRARVGLEKGVERPLSTKETELANAINDLHEKGKSWEAIRRILTNSGRLPKMSRQNFHKLLTALGCPTPETVRNIQSSLRVTR